MWEYVYQIYRPVIGEGARPSEGAAPPWRFVYNGDRVLELTDDANTPLVRYATENGSYYSPYLRANIIGNRCSGASIRYPLYDGGGNFTWVADVNGGICDHNQWDAFGLIFSDPSPQNYSWGGAWGYMEERPGSGLVQLGARWYWPELGRFIEQDPAGGLPDPNRVARQSLPNPTALLLRRTRGPRASFPEPVQPLPWNGNRYAYAANNPLTHTDPDGQCWQVVVVVVVIVAIIVMEMADVFRGEEGPQHVEPACPQRPMVPPPPPAAGGMSPEPIP